MMRCKAPYFVLVLLMATVASAGETLDQVAARLDALARQYKTIRYRVELSSVMTYNGQVVRGTQEMDHEILRLPDGRAMTRYETHSRVHRPDSTRPAEAGSLGQDDESSALSIYDGRYLYDLRRGPKRIFAVKTSPAHNPYDPVGRLQQAREQFDVGLLPEQTLEGKEVYALEFLTRPSQATAVVSRIVSYTDRQTGLPIKTISYDKEGRAVNTATVVESHVNEEIPADHFVFRAPPGVQVEDRTVGGGAPAPRGVDGAK
jgi:outer membrane lipoprotein-sorting protein